MVIINRYLLWFCLYMELLFFFFFRDELSNLLFKENKICYSN